MTIILSFLFLEARALGTAVEDIIFTYNIHNFIVLACIKGINQMLIIMRTYISISLKCYVILFICWLDYTVLDKGIYILEHKKDLKVKGRTSRYI